MSSHPDIWDHAALDYDRERATDTTYQHCVRLACRAVRGHSVLDVGCGTGLTTAPLCRRGRRITAVDYSLGSLRVLIGKRLACAALQADITALPFDSGSFDAVLCANTLQHLTPPDQARAVCELRRVLAPGGTLVVTVHHYSRDKAALGWIKEGKPGQPGIDYIFRFTRADLAALLPDADIQAIGFRSRLERFTPPAIRRARARRGDGHMLMATTHLPRIRRPNQSSASTSTSSIE